MFDGFIYRLLDKIISMCEYLKELHIKNSLPKSGKNDLKKWVRQNEHKNGDDCQ